MSKKQLFFISALMLVCVALGAILVTDFNKTPFGFAGPDAKLGADNPPVSPTNEVKSINDAFVAVSKAVTPQVVSIVVTSKGSISDQGGDDEDDSPFGMFDFRMPKNMPQRGSGSGVIISPDGYILTNNHVVDMGSSGTLSVELTDGRKFDGRIIGRDPLTDLAVIKIDATGLQAAALGNSDEVQVGQLVVAVGNPLGLNSTVTQGIISALGRGQLNLNRDKEGYGVEDFMQTDAAINPGNSGGGLFDLRGALIGINAAIATRTGAYEGYGFTIPINLARSVALDLIDDGKINRGYIGVKIAPVTEILAKGLGLSSRDGVLVQDVVPGGSAATAGLKQGDVILEVDGQKVNAPNHLQAVVAQKRAGQQVNLKVFRDGKTFDRAVTLRPREDSDDEARAEPTRNSAPSERDAEGSMQYPKLGFEVRGLDPQAKRSRSVDGGVVVSKLEEYGEAYNDGLLEGDIILSVNRKPVKTTSDFRGVVDNVQTGDVLLMQVKGRDGSTRLVAIEAK